MAHTLVIETQAETDYQLLLGLAHRLGLRVRESNETQTDNTGRQSALLPNPDKAEVDPTKRPLGTMKGSFRMAPDFDEPLDDLNDYM